MTVIDLGLDVGFDRHALDKPDHDHAGLTYGFTVVSQPGNPVALARGLTTGSHLTVTLYDLTEAAGEAPIVDVDFLSLSLELARARDQQHDKPLALLDGGAETDRWDRFRIFRALAETGGSTVFGGAYPSWNVLTPDGGSAGYPEDQRQADPGAPQAMFEVVHHGAYYLTVRLEVGWTDDAGQRHRKSFREDPEMIIDTT